MLTGKYISSFLILVSFAVLAMSYTIEGQNIFDPSSASFFPAIVGAVMLLCSILIGRRGIHPPSSTQQNATHHEPMESKKEEAEEENLYESENITQKEINVRLLLFVVLVILFAILMNYLNFMVVSFLFLMASMLLLSKQKRFVSFLVSAITSILFYYIFVHVFHIVFPS
jgi:hypothetical protein